MAFGISSWKDFKEAAAAVAQIGGAYAAYQGVRTARKAQKQQGRMLAAQEAEQQKVAAEAKAEKNWADREMRWRMSAGRRRTGGGYGMNRYGGYPTGY